MLWRRATSAYARLCEARLRTPISDTPVALLHDLRYGEVEMQQTQLSD